MISTDVENAIAAQKIQIPLVIHVIEIRALGTRIDFVETDDALRCHERAIYMPLVQLVIFAKTRGNDLFQIKSHEKENFSDSRSERKSCRASVSGAVAFYRKALQKRPYKQKSCRIQSESCSSIL